MVGSFGILLFIILLSVDEGLDCGKCEDGIRATLNTQGKLNALVIVIHNEKMVVILSESLYSTEKINSLQFINNYLYELSRVNMDTMINIFWWKIMDKFCII